MAIDVRQAMAAPGLRGLVRGYQQRSGTLAGAGIVLPLPARPNSFIEFYFAEPYRARSGSSGFAATPDTMVVGAMTGRHTDLLMQGDVGAFNIQFEASGLERLLGTPMIDAAVAASTVDTALHGLRDAVLRAGDFEGRIAAAECWLAARLDSARSYDCVDHAARLLRRSRGTLGLDALATASGLGRRQLQRRFIAQVGLTPKLYARILRFDALLAARDARPGRSWTDLAHAHGYFDQAHLQRDFHSFAGTAPGGFATPLPIVRA
jgi:AraC-like DNA-binding protein